ncbi:hypothetical protein HDV62DRAFT_229023 [Trichoderma sp. SZMC 28011]
MPLTGYASVISLQATPPADLQLTLTMTDPGSSKASRPTTTRQRCSAVDPHVEERGSCCSLQPALKPLSLGLSSWEGERILGIIRCHLGPETILPNLRPRSRTICYDYRACLYTVPVLVPLPARIFTKREGTETAVYGTFGLLPGCPAHQIC